VFQCPGAMTSSGAAWSFYGCQDQVTTTPTCNQNDFPDSHDYDCAPIGKLTLATGAVEAPPGGSVIPMYQCPGVTPLGGGAWGYYGCQNQIASTPTCLEIESPKKQEFPCTPIGSMVLEP
jgi:hypothetical protein